VVQADSVEEETVLKEIIPQQHKMVLLIRAAEVVVLKAMLVLIEQVKQAVQA
jgi:hypothetical protein